MNKMVYKFLLARDAFISEIHLKTNKYKSLKKQEIQDMAY